MLDTKEFMPRWKLNVNHIRHKTNRRLYAKFRLLAFKAIGASESKINPFRKLLDGLKQLGKEFISNIAIV
jgi:hypothetical protein